MLVKLSLLFPPLARKDRSAKKNALSHQQWINADRIVMLLLFIGAIAGAIIFS